MVCSGCITVLAIFPPILVLADRWKHFTDARRERKDGQISPASQLDQEHCDG